MALTLVLVARSLTMLSTMGGLLVGDHLAWRHWTEDVLLALHLEDVVVRSAVADDSSTTRKSPTSGAPILPTDGALQVRH